MLANMEKYLEVGDQVVKIVSYRTAEHRRKRPDGLPAALMTVLPLFERACPSALSPDATAAFDGVADELWEQFCTRADRLADETGRPEWRDPSRLPPWELLKLMGVAIAAGCTYAAGGLGDPDDDIPPWVQRVEAVRLILTSAAQVVLKDTRRLGWLVAQTLSRRRLRTLCRHYTAALHGLFYAAKRARGLHPQVYVLSIRGRADFSHFAGHAWNWYVDARKREIVALDLTGADWLLDRGQADSILNRGFDGARWNNVSCFLSTLFDAFGTPPSPLHERREVIELVAALVDPATPRGQALLFRLAQQLTVSDAARSRIVDRLRAENFSQTFPGWRTELVPGSLFLRAAARMGRFRNQALDEVLLDAIGV